MTLGLLFSFLYLNEFSKINWGFHFLASGVFRLRFDMDRDLVAFDWCDKLVQRLFLHGVCLG